MFVDLVWKKKGRFISLRIFNGNILCCVEHNSVPALPLIPQEFLGEQLWASGEEEQHPSPRPLKIIYFTVVGFSYLDYFHLDYFWYRIWVWWLSKPHKSHTQVCIFLSDALNTPWVSDLKCIRDVSVLPFVPLLSQHSKQFSKRV